MKLPNVQLIYVSSFNALEFVYSIHSVLFWMQVVCALDVCQSSVYFLAFHIVSDQHDKLCSTLNVSNCSCVAIQFWFGLRRVIKSIHCCICAVLVSIHFSGFGKKKQRGTNIILLLQTQYSYQRFQSTLKTFNFSFVFHLDHDLPHSQSVCEKVRKYRIKSK